MKMYNLILTIAVFLNINLSYAGNEVGNGGVGFWCPESKKYLLLDFYEYELINPKSKIVIANDKTVENILNDQLLILSKLDEKNFTRYNSQAKKILEKVSFLDEITLNKSNDSFEIATPSGCILKQFALQRENEKDHVTEFYFDKIIWNTLDSRSKAGLLLHEIIYEQFAYFGEKNSLKVRKFNSFIFSENFKSITPAEYKKFIQDLRLPLY